MNGLEILLLSDKDQRHEQLHSCTFASVLLYFELLSGAAVGAAVVAAVRALSWLSPSSTPCPLVAERVGVLDLQQFAVLLLSKDSLLAFAQQVALCVLLVGVLWMLARITRIPSPSLHNQHRPSLGQLLSTSAPCLGAVAISVVLTTFAQVEGAPSAHHTCTNSGLFDPSRFWASVATTPVCEELLFRVAFCSIIFNRIPTRTNLVVAIGAVVFSVAHLPSLLSTDNAAFVWWQSLHALLVGACFCALFLRSGSVLSCIAIHAVNNLFACFTPPEATKSSVYRNLRLVMMVVWLWALLLTMQVGKKKIS